MGVPPNEEGKPKRDNTSTSRARRRLGPKLESDILTVWVHSADLELQLTFYAFKVPLILLTPSQRKQLKDVYANFRGPGTVSIKAITIFMRLTSTIWLGN